MELEYDFALLEDAELFPDPLQSSLVSAITIAPIMIKNIKAENASDKN
jgi:hypothetical protein